MLDILVDGRCVRLNLWDTAGQEDYDRLRPLTYSHANVFLLCFSLDSRQTLMSAKGKWSAEIKK